MANNDSPVQQVADLLPENNIDPEVDGEVPLDMLEYDIDEDYSPVTPEQNVDLLNGNSREPMSETFLVSEFGTAYLSTKEYSETMSSSSSSSLGDEIMKPKIINVDEKENLNPGNEVALKKMMGLQYEELLERVASYEIELKLAKEKLQTKQDEIAHLKYENLTLVEELGMAVDNLRTYEDNMAKREEEFRIELFDTRHQLLSELDSERKLVAELQGTLVLKTDVLEECDHETDELKQALYDAQEDFMKNRSKLESEIANSHGQRDSLEEEIENYEKEKAKLKGFHESQVTGLLDEIRTLKEDLCQRDGMVESLNKTLEGCKLRHEILEAEKDEALAKIHTLEAEMNRRDTKIEQMEEHIKKLTAENKEMVCELKKTHEMAEELTVKVDNQEKELEKQRVVISERGDEKREAIKQLCFSLEYYRNEYQELCHTFIKHKRPALLAS